MTFREYADMKDNPLGGVDLIDYQYTTKRPPSEVFRYDADNFLVVDADPKDVIMNKPVGDYEVRFINESGW